MVAPTLVLERFRERLSGWAVLRKVFHRRQVGHSAHSSGDQSAEPGGRAEHENHIPYMGGGTQHKVERLARSTLIAFGFVFAVADLTGVFNWLPHWFIPDVTLFVLCTVALYLVLDTRNARVLGQAVGRTELMISKLYIDAIDRYGGVVRVHEQFDDKAFNRYIGAAQNEVEILNTWAPNLSAFQDSLQAALDRRVSVRVLLLFPSSAVAKLRDEALRAVQYTEESADQELVEGDVEQGVHDCLRILDRIYHSCPSSRQNLRVRLYNSLPPISVYKADERYFVGVFPHGRLAIKSPQFEVEGKGTRVGEIAQGELDTLWRIGQEVNMAQWQCSLNNMQF